MRKHVFVLLFIIYYVDSIIASAYRDKNRWPGYYPELQGWLKLHTEPTDYQDATVKCHMEDDLVAAAWNSDFTNALVGLIPSLGSTEDQELALYSGSDGVYTLNEGEPVLTVGSNTSKKHCEVIFANATKGEVDCKQRFPFACYSHAPACGQDPSSDYTLLTRGGHCYKYYPQNVNWTQAYETCRKDGTYLAVVNSQAEAQVLGRIIPVNIGHNFALVGFYFWKAGMTWRTVQGQSLEEAGFSKWRSGEPTPGAYSGILISEGELGSVRNDKEGPFICEMDPVLALENTS